jgi:hypothetical protein
MPTTIQITTDNYDGQSAVITYYPDTGGTINLGTQVLPYDYNVDYYYGTYSLYFPVFDITCTLVIANQTPTPSATMTPTPTITPTMTPTPTPTLPQQYYVYQICNSNPSQYIVQTQPGYTIISGKVIRNGFDYGFPIGIIYSCWEFLYVTNTFPTFPPGTNVTNYTGNFFTMINPQSPFDKCSDCLSYVEPPKPTTYVLLGPYASDTLACVAGNQNGVAGLGFTTFSNNNPAIGSQVYTSSLFGGQQLVTTPGWYSYSASFTGGGIYNTIYIDNTGTIIQTGQSCISVIIP